MISPEDIKGPEELRRMNIDELNSLARSMREFIIRTVSGTGGHIGANLGTVELAIALHSVFDSPSEPIIWDTGHQGYAHKVITGRGALLKTLNTRDGMSRFISRRESGHDIIDASHAGTSISAALGIALARRIKGVRLPVAAVIGDGSICEGMALEGLNHAVAEKGIRLVIILNDNGYAISRGFGGIHNYLQSRRPEREEKLFTSLGAKYTGPVDGHDIRAMTEAFREVKDSEGVSVVHVRTTKGYGLEAADRHQYRMHFSFPFDPVTGKTTGEYSYTGYQDAASKAISGEMERDDSIVCVTASTVYATGLEPIAKAYPHRFFDPGMEEQHAMTLAAGLSLEGMKPVVFFQSTFMQRAFDQLFHDICYMDLPVLLLSVRSGLSGYDSPTHHGIYDLSYLRALPNLRILYPKDGYELERMVRDNLKTLSGPVLVCIPYGPVDEFSKEALHEPADSFAKAEVVREGRDMLIIAVGNRFGAAKEAMRRLRWQGWDCGLVNLRYVKPLPEAQLAILLDQSPRVVTVEEGVLDGGVGSSIAALMADRGLRCELLRIGLPTVFVEPGPSADICSAYGIDANGILKKIKGRWHEPQSASRKNRHSDRRFSGDR